MILPTFDTIAITRVISAPIADVWKAWTAPGLVLDWFGSDPNGYGLKAELDVKAGGAYEVSFSNSDRSEHTCRGTYIEVKAPEKLIFSWEWKSEPGVVSTVTVLFSQQGNSTRMQFEHAGVGSRSAHNYHVGWQGAFNKLEKLLTTPK